MSRHLQETAAQPVISARRLTKSYVLRGSQVRRVLGKPNEVLHALDSVDIDILRGEIFGLVGESGSGKTTLGRCLLRLIEPTSGEILLNGKPITRLRPGEMQRVRRKVQMIFQDPISSLNPRLTVSQALQEVLRVHRLCAPTEVEGKTLELLGMVGLPTYVRHRLPSQLSGGQLQRVGIARALAMGPEFIVADEPVSAIDVSVQAQVLTLLLHLKKTLGLTLLFIAHDLSVVQYISNRVGVMYLGRLVEVAGCDEIYGHPRHPYTVGLLNAVPRPDPTRRNNTVAIQGDPPSPVNLPSGCRFRTRCPLATEICGHVEPALMEVAPGHAVACHHHDAVVWTPGEGPSGTQDAGTASPADEDARANHSAMD